MLEEVPGTHWKVIVRHLPKGGNDMNDPNRVLSRQNARQLTEAENERVSGGFITFSFCSAVPTPDGDRHPFEEGC